MEAVQMSLPTLATAELEAMYEVERKTNIAEAARARTANVARRNAVRMQADRAGRLAANQARRSVYLANGYRECAHVNCSTLVSPGYELCIPHSQAQTKPA